MKKLPSKFGWLRTGEKVWIEKASGETVKIRYVGGRQHGESLTINIADLSFDRPSAKQVNIPPCNSPKIPR